MAPSLLLAPRRFAEPFCKKSFKSCLFARFFNNKITLAVRNNAEIHKGSLKMGQLT